MPVRRWPPLSLGTLLALVAHAPAEEPVQFNRDVRPILADKCFHCHGPDAAHRQADLRLDVRDAALAAQAFTPGQPAKSQLIARIESTDPDEVMPPPGSNKTLTAQEKDILRRWVVAGAEYQGHWAFLAPQRPSPPKLDDSGVVNPVDQFIRARLAQEKLAPAPEASRETLIRRLSLDLTGIPPTPAEIDAFLGDTSDKAYEKVVDRLLASPRYGERMAQQWLDYARYADSNGFQTDSSRQMWRWREWVIGAFNRNLPFDQFTLEQLAGDLLPGAAPEQIVATGFHRNPRLNGEGGRIVEEWFAETVIDRVDTTGQTWLGLTLGCCRCHDHKYDPLTQKEFYQLFAFFNSIDESGVLDSEGGNRGGGNSRPLLTVPSTEQAAELAALTAQLAAAQEQLAAAEKESAPLQAAWEAKFKAQLDQQQAVWAPLVVEKVVSRGGATLQEQGDGSWLASGKNPPGDLYTITAQLPAGQLSGLRLELLPDASLPNQSLGRGSNGNLVLTGVEAELTLPGDKLAARGKGKAAGKAAVKVVFTTAAADFEQAGYPAATLLVKGGSGWAIEGNKPENRVSRKAMLLTAAPVDVPAGAVLTIRLKHESRFADHNVGRFRLAATSLAPALVKLDGASLPATLRTALNTEPAQRTPAQQAEIARFFREQGDSPAAKVQAQINQLRSRMQAIQEAQPTTMVMKELPQPRAAFILKRGEYDKPGERVERALPAALPPLPAGAPLNRLGLAQWLVSPQHPLTARVWVNRQWERFFGVGLVKTIDNFGLQSDPPSHPELLDWLATEFVRLGWDMKALQKTLVMSGTYRQASRVTPELLARDPENRLLARGPRVRLPAEVIRDQALAVSGLLVEKLGGPSVRPYMPAGVWDETSKYGDLRGYQADQGDGLYRRTLYTIWKRTAAPPTMLMFDSPSREVCAVKRSRTNTPLQALALLNEVTYVEAARALAQQTLAHGGPTAGERLAWAFRRVTGRQPEADELALLVRGLEKQQARFAADAPSAQQLLAQGRAPVATGVDPAELAAYTLAANVLLNLDEVVTKE